MKISTNVTKVVTKKKGGGGSEDPKKKTTSTAPKLADRVVRYQGYESAAHGGMGTERGFSTLPKGNYSGNPAPRVGGNAPKASGLKGGTKAHMKAGKSMVRKGTGDGAKKR
jgi:hypothetical protein